MNEFQLPLKTRTLNQVRRFFMVQPLEAAIYLAARNGPWAAKLAPNHYQYPKPTLRRASRRGIHYDLDISDLIDWHVYFDILDESCDRLISLCRPGFTVLDVGSNIGAMLLRMAKTVGPHGRIYGFEPCAEIYKKCFVNIRLNEFGNSSVEPIALGAESGFVHMTNLDKRNLGHTSVVEGGGERVRVTSIDRFVSERGIQKIDLIKIDVEGFEPQVLKGAQESIRAFRPLLFIEISDQNLRRMGTSAVALVKGVRALGYATFRAESNAPLDVIENLDGAHFDAICRPEPR